MKSDGLKTPDRRELGDQKLQEDLNRLRLIADALREMGFTIADNLITINQLEDPASDMGFQIVKDGSGSIRASYSRARGLRIWFTNELEDPEHPRRQEVKKRLQEMGLI